MRGEPNEESYIVTMLSSRRVRALAYAALWYGSIFSGFLFIACPLLPLVLLYPPAYRKCIELLFCVWEMYPAALMDVFGVKVVVSGDHILPDDSAIMVMNHRTRVDWNFLWGAMYQSCLPHVAAHKLKFVLKDPIRHIPGPGWLMQMNGFLYITRRWEEDQGRLSQALDYLVELRRRSQVLIFPEGTDLTANSKKRSDKYAKDHGLPKYTYTLHPKTTGFSYLVNHLQTTKYLDSVYDITIGYPDNIPQSEIEMVTGKLPDEVHFHVTRISRKNLPTDEAGLRHWLENRWKAKEQVLEDFYVKKRFTSNPWPMAGRSPLKIAFIFWTALTGAMWIFFLISPIFKLWTLFNILLFIGLSFFSSGFNQLEIKWYRLWKTGFKRKVG